MKNESFERWFNPKITLTENLQKFAGICDGLQAKAINPDNVEGLKPVLADALKIFEGLVDKCKTCEFNLNEEIALVCAASDFELLMRASALHRGFDANKFEVSVSNDVLTDKVMGKIEKPLTHMNVEAKCLGIPVPDSLKTCTISSEKNR